AVAEGGEHVGRVEERFPAQQVVPDVDGLVALHHRIGLHPAAAVGPILIGDAHVAALGAPLPAVERALDHLAEHFSAEPEVRAEVLTVGVHHGHPAALRAPGPHLLAEVLHRADLADYD